MKPSIQPHYDINRHTLAIMPAYHTDYETIVYENHQIYYVAESSLSMIKRACIEGGATYDGRRTAVSEITRAQSKVPIPIDTIDQIYTFPTHSPTKLECSWFFYHHIRTFMPDPDHAAKTIITFRNSIQLTIDATYATIERQIQRTSYCILRLTYRPYKTEQVMRQINYSPAHY
ncbi:competence protein ComK [Alkalihalophilus pseudofirmus]|uniref:competence protein ComK n=1 Tax=Alkalihalophilus pseudofirmus TaxID=79885 RepID=UPI00259B1CDC|nr:competence protein ComK [Alkalihalophilus pseudofirmus]WEG18942.1 competence protein ComK [Alkalihalophilus pseudofirmus]